MMVLGFVGLVWFFLVWVLVFGFLFVCFSLFVGFFVVVVVVFPLH